MAINIYLFSNKNYLCCILAEQEQSWKFQKRSLVESGAKILKGLFTSCIHNFFNLSFRYPAILLFFFLCHSFSKICNKQTGTSKSPNIRKITKKKPTYIYSKQTSHDHHLFFTFFYIFFFSALFFISSLCLFIIATKRKKICIKRYKNRKMHHKKQHILYLTIHILLIKMIFNSHLIFTSISPMSIE